jgi:hypothetical protein
MGTTSQAFGNFGEHYHFKPEKFVGRQAELAYLNTRLIIEQRRVGLLTGNNATGKTWLALYFAGHYSTELKDKTEVIDSFHIQRDLPDLRPTTELVIIDDASSLNFEATDRLLRYIDNNPDKQFLLISVHENDLLNRHINYKLRLNNLSEEDSLKMLSQLLAKKMGPQQAVKILSWTQGNPYIISLVSNYLNDAYHNYTLNDIHAMIYDNLQRSGITDQFGQPLNPASLEFKHMVGDIQFVNATFLERIKYRPEDIYKLGHREFEEMIAELMGKRGYDVTLTPATRDGGKDLIIAKNKDIGNFIYYVECKHYQPDNSVGVHLVRELGGTVLADRVTAGIMITSSYFTKKAVEYSHKLEHQLSLVDFIKLKEWLKF